MNFKVEFYATVSGKVPVEAFLEELAGTDSTAHQHILRRIVRLQDSGNHGEPLTKEVGDGLFELRYLGRLNTRILWFYRAGRRIILLHGIRNKGQKIDPADLDIARNRMGDWIRRYGQ